MIIKLPYFNDRNIFVFNFSLTIRLVHKVSNDCILKFAHLKISVSTDNGLFEKNQCHYC